MMKKIREEKRLFKKNIQFMYQMCLQLIQNLGKHILLLINISVPTRINYAFLEDGTKVRISKKTGALIPKPEYNNLKYVNRTKDK